MTADKNGQGNGDFKLRDLEQNREDGTEQFLTTNQGVRINDNQNSLKAGERGATLLEDFILREKITHFDHERIPERIVHARGAGAHGYFQVYESMAKYTKAKFLQDPSVKTPVFVRFSTVVGSRGSTDLARDIRGFAVKFYTEEGNYDLVGNNAPVFFIQDAMKFPDLVHSVKPEPHNEIPQAAAAHDTFWDFISLMPESMHAIFWAMSDRAIPRSFRMMEGFGVHTFRFINEEGKSHFVKFHWKPLLGLHSVLWDEATRISGKDPDFHRRDLWDAIEAGAYPEYEFGVQIIAEEDEHKFEFDLLDPTKIIPEELVPVQRIGKMTLNRNPDNFFAETEQIAFHPGHIVPGIDFTNDPLLQGRLFSYLDTQLSRLGGPNFHEIPINRPIVPIHNNQRDAQMRQMINKGRVSYDPNSLGGGCPFQAMMADGGFHSYEERMDARKVRARSESFRDHFTQPALFYHSQSEAEKKHMVDAFSFELGKVEMVAIRQRMVNILTQIDMDLANKVAANLGLATQSPEQPINHSFGANTDPKTVQPTGKRNYLDRSEALSMENTVKNTIKTRRVAFLAADGVDDDALDAMKKSLTEEGAMVKIIASRHGSIKTASGAEVEVDATWLTTSSVLFDAVYIPGGKTSVDALAEEMDAVHFVNEAFKHCKAIAGVGEGVEFIKNQTYAGKDETDKAVIFGGTAKEMAKPFVAAIAQHRNWEREMAHKVPA
ncbi:catalase HPII [Nitrosomonas communis]|uniref:Catalase n=1 Tax=Nitrosomonas communis TaxID=44574 RepID=A0A1H2ZQ62_9PROT|nr:catalase HPII [Nitrosomonas communis]SDX19517.1 catalase [Nitrosomonas communis]